MTTTMIDFGDIINQIYRREMNRLYEFNLMLVGLSGFGKSSLVRSLFRGKIKPKEVSGGPVLNEYEEIIEDNGVSLKLRCVETSNFKTHDHKLYIEYLEGKLNNYFVDSRRQLSPEDNRIHCCLYFITPYGKMRLEDEDIECMKALHERVNLVPIIPKSEFHDSTQRAKFKENILNDLKQHKIKYFMFSYDEKEDSDRAICVRQEAERFPFAVVAADEPVVENNRIRWLRKTDSCIIDIFDKKYDFDALSKLVIQHCMINLIDSTHTNHYARFMAELLERYDDEGAKVLEAVGLEPHEIFILKYFSSGDKRTLKQFCCEMEEGLSSRPVQPPPAKIARPKPPVLHEKPEFLRARSTMSSK